MRQASTGPGGQRGARGRPARSAGPRSPARPARRAAGEPGTAKRTRAPRPNRLTGRATVLGMLLIGLLMAYAYPVRVYLSQQAEISTLEKQQDAQRRHIGDLADERAKWNDDEYVKAQARRRLHYVLPGEVPLVVIDSRPGAAAKPADPKAADKGPWYGKLWSSLQAADRP